MKDFRPQAMAYQVIDRIACNSGNHHAHHGYRQIKPPKGEVYGRAENPKGELGFYIVSDGAANPYRYHVRAPTFINLTSLEKMSIGHKIADSVVILGAIDIVLGEVDR
mgnify:CR=1 FL=1